MKLTITHNMAIEAVEFSLALANSYDPAMRPIDRLTDQETANSILGKYLKSGESLSGIIQKLIPFRNDLRNGLIRLSENVPTPQTPDVNVLSALNLSWRMELEDSNNPGLNLTPEGEAWQRVAAWAALGYLALLDTKDGRLRVCESRPCEEIFVDRTKSGRQKFCCKRCANRFNVARYRARQSNSANKRL